MAIMEIKVPDLDGMTDVGVVEVYVSPGELIEVETPLISLESDKAVMDVPSPVKGTITEIQVAEGDTVNTGDVIALAEISSSEETAAPPETPTPAEEALAPAEAPAPPEEATAPPEAAAPPEAPKPPAPAKAAGLSSEPPAPIEVNAPRLGAPTHATPSVRILARELGVNLSLLQGSGPKGRITREDLTSWVKQNVQGRGAAQASGGGAFTLPPIPSEDYSAFGPVTSENLSRIKKISGPHLHRNWLGIPHVTQFEEADITELEAFRQELNKENIKNGLGKISPLIFIIKAAGRALREFPDFNSSLNPDGTSVTRKDYINMGIAVDTPGGLVVPIIPHADQKGIQELSALVTELGRRAREGKLKASEMQGATFTISSLGGIGGTWFTPIVNAPQAAILGVSRSRMQPVWQENGFVPRLMLPLSLSYDHRIIDGAQGARFAAYLSSLLGDFRRVML